MSDEDSKLTIKADGKGSDTLPLEKIQEAARVFDAQPVPQYNRYVYDPETGIMKRIS